MGRRSDQQFFDLALVMWSRSSKNSVISWLFCALPKRTRSPSSRLLDSLLFRPRSTRCRAMRFRRSPPRPARARGRCLDWSVSAPPSHPCETGLDARDPRRRRRSRLLADLREHKPRWRRPRYLAAPLGPPSVIMERINTCGMGHHDGPCPRSRFSRDDLPVAFAGPRGRFRQGRGGVRSAHGPLPDVLFCSVSETIGVSLG